MREVFVKLGTHSVRMMRLETVYTRGYLPIGHTCNARYLSLTGKRRLDPKSPWRRIRITGVERATANSKAVYTAEDCFGPIGEE